uniref:Yir3 protein n=1 Tax=Parastrongyloides trichosuri TaxID=131310 RepID=A0A0N4ZK09_PARTI
MKVPSIEIVQSTNNLLNYELFNIHSGNDHLLCDSHYHSKIYCQHNGFFHTTENYESIKDNPHEKIIKGNYQNADLYIQEDTSKTWRVVKYLPVIILFVLSITFFMVTIAYGLYTFMKRSNKQRKDKRAKFY